MYTERERERDVWYGMDDKAARAGMCMLYVYIDASVYKHIYIYIERERERDVYMLTYIHVYAYIYIYIYIYIEILSGVICYCMLVHATPRHVTFTGFRTGSG